MVREVSGSAGGGYRLGMSVTAIGELTLAVRDPEAVASFYEAAFGLKRLADDEDRIWLGVGEHARIGLWTPGTKEFGDQGGAHVHFAFTVDRGSMDDLAERVRRAGGQVDGPLAHPGGDRSLYVRDPAGNVVEAWDMFDGAKSVECVSDQ